MGNAERVPAVFLALAQLILRMAYGRAILQGQWLGFVTGLGRAEFARVAWIARQLGRADARSVTLAGRVAIDGIDGYLLRGPVVIGLRRGTGVRPYAAVALWGAIPCSIPQPWSSGIRLGGTGLA